MSQNNMELLRWADGKVHLSYWDTKNGEDIIFTLYEDGKAIPIEGKQSVNLVKELINLCNTLQRNSL